MLLTGRRLSLTWLGMMASTCVVSPCICCTVAPPKPLPATLASIPFSVIPLAVRLAEPCETRASMEAGALDETEVEVLGVIPWGFVAWHSVMSSTTMGCSESSTSPPNPRGVNCGSWVRVTEDRPPSAGESKDSVLTSGWEPPGWWFEEQPLDRRQ